MILSCDAGFKSTGCAVIAPDRIVALWVMHTEPADGKKRHFYVMDNDAHRCADIARMLRATIDRYKIRCLICELPTGAAKGARAMRCMALATGVFVCVSELLRIPTVWVTPLQVKGVAGKMNASKEHIIEAVLQRIPALKDHPAWLAINKTSREHAADALAAFLASQRHPIVQSIMNEAKLLGGPRNDSDHGEVLQSPAGAPGPAGAPSGTG